MNTLTPFLSLPYSCDEALRFSSRNLTQCGFRLMQTFDLKAARLGLEDCLCPHHGTSACDCQMVVLLIYGDASAPAVLVLHGSDGQTLLSLVDAPGQQTDPRMSAAIRTALEQAHSIP